VGRTGIRYEQALRALQFRWRDAPADAVVSVSTAAADDTNFQTRLFRVAELEHVAELYEGSESNVWTRVSVLPPDYDTADGGRGSEAATLGTALCHVDLDPHLQDGEDWDGWRQRKLRELEAFYPRPSGIEFSGRGYYAFWRIPFTTDWQRVKRINRYLANALEGDDCYDIARILRLPGTMNPKEGVLRYAEIVRHSDDPPYSLDNFQEEDLPRVEREIDEQGAVSAEPLALDFVRRLQATSAKLWGRIISEQTARDAGAELRKDGSGRVDRSRNDMTIAIQLLRAGLSAGQVYSVLTHEEWFCGERFRELRYSGSYVQVTIHRAMEVASSPEQTNHVLIAQDLLQKDHLLNYVMEWRRYDPDTGVYEPAEYWLEQYVQDVTGLKWRSAITEEVKKYLAARVTFQEKDQALLQRLTCVGNGMLDWRTGELLDHGTGYLVVSGIDARWDPDADCTAVDEFVAEILREEDIPLWWMFSGYLLHTTTPLPHRCILGLVGPKATGKSTLLRCLVSFIGAQNVSTVSLSMFGGAGNQFTTSALVGKMLNVDFDAPYDYPIRDIHTLKKIATGDSIQIEKKHAGALSAALPVKLAFAMNGYPVAEKGDEGYYDRWRIALVRNDHRFNETNPERRINADVALMANPANRSAWLRRSVEGRRALDAHGGFPDNRESKEELREQSDPIYRFWKTVTVAVPVPDLIRDYVPMGRFYPYYVSWCNEMGQRPDSQRAFSARSRDLLEEQMLPGAFAKQDSTRNVWTVAGRQPKQTVTIKEVEPK
jgi:P4 family phage/plasmid primase-like protien